MKYWVRVNKESLGPVSADQIQKISGVTENALVCPEGATATSDWRKLRDVPELAQALRRASSPPLPPEESSPPPKDSVKCPKCGATQEFDEDAVHCDQCGSFFKNEQSARAQALPEKSSSRAAIIPIVGVLILCLIPMFYLLMAYGTLSPCGALAQESPRMSLEAMGMQSAQVNIILAFNSASAAIENPLAFGRPVNGFDQVKCAVTLVKYKLGENQFNGISSKQGKTQ